MTSRDNVPDPSQQDLLILWGGMYSGNLESGSISHYINLLITYDEPLIHHSQVSQRKEDNRTQHLPSQHHSHSPHPKERERYIIHWLCPGYIRERMLQNTL